MTKFLVAFETEVIVDADCYELAVVEAYKVVKGGTVHISRIEEIKPIGAEVRLA